MNRQADVEQAEAPLPTLLRRLKEGPDYAAFAAVGSLKRIETASGTAARAMLRLLPRESGVRPGDQSAEFIEAHSLEPRLAMFVGIRLRMLSAIRDFMDSILISGRNE